MKNNLNIQPRNLKKLWNLAFSATLVLLAQSGLAASGVWSSAASGNWSTGPWTGGTPNGSTDIATFSNNWSGQIITVDIPVIVGQIQAADTNATTSGLTISGGTLTLDNGANPPVISTFTNNAFAESAASRLKISSVLDGANGFERQGSGYLDISGVTSLFTGTVKLTAPAAGGGSFTVINSDANLGNAANTITATLTGQPVGFYNDASAGTFALNPARSITTSGTGDFWVKNKAGASMTIGGAISGTARLRKNDTGTLILTNNNTFSGGILVEGGTLKMSGGHNLSFGTSAQFGMGATINNTTLDMSELGSFSFNRPAGYDFQVSSSGASITNIIYLAKTGFNMINATNVRFGGGGQNAANQWVIAGLGRTNTVNAANEFLVGYFQGNCNMSFQSGLTSPTLIVRGADGGASSAIGLFRVGQCNSGAQPTTGILNLAGGSLDVVATNFDVAAQIAGASTAATGILTMPAGNVVASVLSVARKSNTAGTPTVTGTFNQGGGTVTATNLYLGNNESANAANLIANYNLSGGELLATTIGRNGSVFGGSSAYNLNFTGGTLRNIPGAGLTVTDVTISAPTNWVRYVTAESGQTIALNNKVTQGAVTAAPIVLNGAGTVDFQGTMDNSWLGLNVSNGVALLSKSSSGSINAIGNDSVINGGVIRLAGTGGNQIYDARLITINSGSFDVNGQTETIGGLAGNGGSIVDPTASGTLTISVASGTNYTSGSSITGGNLAFAGAGTQIYIGTDSRVTETTTVNNGTLQIGNGGASGTLSGSGVTVNSPGALAFNRSGTFGFGGSISGNGNVAQNGAGTLILSNDTRTAGSTLVNTGTLAVAGGASTVGGAIITVASGATLNTTAGSGFYIQGNQILNGSGNVNGGYILSTGATNSGNLTVTGDLTLTDGSWFNPGAAFSAGTIAVTGNVAFSGGNPNLIYNLASTTTPGGGTNTLLTVSGTLDLSALSAGSLNLYIRGTPASGTYVIATAGSIAGSASAINVIGSTRYTYTPQIVGNQLRLVVTGNAGNLVWLGDGGANIWDANNSGNLVWSNRTSNVIDFFNTGDLALFNDQSANPTVNLTGALLPASLTVSNNSVNYVFNDSGSGSVDGPIALTKAGAGSLTINNNNGFSGAVNVNGGSVSVAAVAANGSAQPLGAGTALNLNGGTFQYTGAAVGAGEFGRSITLGANGGTIDQESTIGIYFFVTNKITGSGSLTKIGSQQLIIGDGASGTGSNDYSGITYLSAGNIQIRNAYALGSPSVKTVIYPGATLSADGTGSGFTNVIPENIELAGGTLQGAGGNANYGGVITVASNSVVGGSSALTISGQITGAGSLDKQGSGTLTVLSTNSNLTGGITNSAGNLQLGNGTANGTLPGDITINAGSLIALPVSGTTIVLPASLHGPGQLLVNNLGGNLALTGSNDWTGNVNIRAGDLWINNSFGLGVGPKNVQINLNNGSGGAACALHLNGTNGSIILTNDIAFETSWVGGVMYNESGNNTVLGNITMTGGGGDSLFVLNAGNLNLAGTVSANAASRGFVFGGPASAVVSGAVVDTNGFVPRELKMQGTGICTVSGTNTTIAPANVSSGKLLITGEWAGAANASGSGTLGGTGNIIGSVSIANGATFSPGTSIGTLNIGGGLTLSNGAALFIEVNKSLVQSNDYTTVTGALNAGTGTLTVSNLGPALAVGDKFTLFSQPVANGNLLTVNGGGVNWTNNLAVDGSISVLSLISTVNTNSFPLTANVSGGSLNLSWPPDRLGWKVQIQTNNLSTGLSNNWVTLPATATVTNYSLPINPANPSVFIRMTYP